MVLLLVSLVLGLMVGCGEEGSVSPVGGGEETYPEEYSIYIATSSGGEVLVVDPSTMISESYSFEEYWPLRLGLTPGGTRLYVGNSSYDQAEDQRTDCINITTGEISPVLSDRLAIVRPATDGRMLLIEQTWQGIYHRIGWVDTLTQEVEFFDSLTVHFSNNIATVYVGSKTPMLYYLSEELGFVGYNYDTRENERFYDSNAWYVTYRGVLNRDETLLYCAGIGVLDLETGTTVGTYPANWKGSVALNTDETRLYVTDPGGYGHDDVEYTNSVYVYDTGTFESLGVINMWDEGIEDDFMTDKIVIPPGKDYAILSHFSTRLTKLDLTTLSVDTSILVGAQVYGDMIYGPKVR